MRGNAAEHVGQAGHARGAELRRGVRRSRATEPGGAVERGIVQHDRHAVPAEPDVQLERVGTLPSASSKAAIVFSGASADAPRCAMTGRAEGSRSGFTL